MARIRCRNCGLWHSTQICPSYGPMFPEPGKTAADYAAVAKKIADRVAADIIAEHDGVEGTEGEIIELKPTRKRRKKSAVPADTATGT